MNNIDFLNNVSIFAGLDQRALSELANRLTRRVFAEGMTIFHRGSQGQNLYIVRYGGVRIFLFSNSGRQMSLNYIRPGECFGEISLIDGRTRSAGAITTEKTETLILRRQDFLDHIQKHPQTANHIMELLCARLRQSTDNAQRMVFLDARSRIIVKLLEMVDQNIVQNSDGEMPDLCISQTELATWVGIRREGVNRILSDMRCQGLVHIDKQIITIANEAALRAQLNVADY
jgi:CRP/FNR family transcriptional regulator, cyclic AMP receptor protein